MPMPHAAAHPQYIENYKKTGIERVIGHIRNVPARHKNGVVLAGQSLDLENLG